MMKRPRDAAQDVEAKLKKAEDDVEGKPSSETLNEAKIKDRTQRTT
jgi:hypothetical protein